MFHLQGWVNIQVLFVSLEAVVERLGKGDCVGKGLRNWVTPGGAAVRIAKYLMLRRQAFGVALK